MVSGSANGIRGDVWEKVSWKAVRRLMDGLDQVLSLYLSNWLVLVRRNCEWVALAVVAFRIMNNQLLVKLALIVKWALARWDGRS